MQKRLSLLCIKFGCHPRVRSITNDLIGFLLQQQALLNRLNLVLNQTNT